MKKVELKRRKSKKFRTYDNTEDKIIKTKEKIEEKYQGRKEVIV